MSAYIVGRETIDRAMTLLVRDGHVPWQDVDEWGKRLWGMNVDAVSQRYAHHAATDGAEWEQTRREIEGYSHLHQHDGPAQLAKALMCLTYQCAEGDVPERAAYQWLREIEKRPEYQALIDTPAYNEASWG